MNRQHQMGGKTGPIGGAAMRHTRHLGDLSQHRGDVKPSLLWRLKNMIEHRRGLSALAGSVVMGRVFGALSVRATLRGVLYQPDWSRLAPDQVLKLKVLLRARVDLTAAQVSALLQELGGYVDVRDLAREFGGGVVNYGLLSTRLVTDNGVAYLVDALQNLTEPENLKFHGFGTGTTAEAQADSALVTELTTQYATDNVRPTGSLTEGASSNIFRTVGTLSPDSGGTLAITEHGIFSQAATGGGTLLDRSKFSAVNLVAGSDSLQATYDLTLSAGG